jgi:transcriptional regulator with XRE-family HTH domain
MNFNKIREYCEERKITIPELASRIGISEPGLYQVLRNKSMKVDLLEKISEVLDFPIWTFFDLDPGKELKVEIERLQKENNAMSNELDYKSGEIMKLRNKYDYAKGRNDSDRGHIISLAKHIKSLEKSIEDKDNIINIYKSLIPNQPKDKSEGEDKQ